MKIIIILFCLWAVLAPPAWAGTYIQSISQSYTDKNDWFTDNLAIDQGKMRFDIQGPDFLSAFKAGKTGLPANTPRSTWTILFDQSTSQFDLVIPSSKAVFELTGEDIAQIKTYLGPVALEMKKYLDNPKKMKKKDRAQYLEMKRSAAQYLDTLSSPVASGVTLNGFRCDEYVIRSKKKKMMECWCMPSTDLPMAPQDYQTTKALANLFLDLAEPFISALGFNMEKLRSHPLLNSFTVCSISYDEKGKPKKCYRILGVKAMDFPPETFNYPATYQKTDVFDFVKMLTKMGSKGKAGGTASQSIPPIP